MPRVDNSIMLEDVRIIFPNFAGKEGQYNREGDRNFCILLTPQQADDLSRDGWNIKTTREREGDDAEILGGEPYLPVTVSYKGRPPHVVLITSRGRTDLGEAEVEMLDHADISMVDVMINPYDWTVNGLSGRKAYLKSMYVTINEDELEMKYSDIGYAGKKTSRDA